MISRPRCVKNVDIILVSFMYLIWYSNFSSYDESVLCRCVKLIRKWRTRVVSEINCVTESYEITIRLITNMIAIRFSVFYFKFALALMLV